jgi:hypothetical protein
MFDLRLRHAHHVRHYTITNVGSAGWEVRLEEDRMLRRHLWYQDWHRVERVKALFEREVTELRAQGWQIA